MGGAEESPGSAHAGSLYSLLLAGTHDSAAYAARPDLLSRTAPITLRPASARAATSRVQREFALTQRLTVLEQLRAGARFLDLRVSKRHGVPADEDEFWTVHGMVLCVPLDEVLGQINAFAAEVGVTEVPVVLCVRTYELSMSERAALGRSIVKTLAGDTFLGDARSLARTPLKRLPPFVLAGVPPSTLPVSWGADVWLDTFTPSRKIPFLSDALESARHKLCRPADSLLVLGWTITPSFVDVVLRIASYGSLRRTVIEEAEDMNCLFERYAAENATVIRERANVVFFDCFSEKEAALVRQIASGKDVDGP